MKHRLLLFLVLPLLLLAVMLASVRVFGGPGDTASAQGIQLYLDLDEDTGWCDDIDNTDSVVPPAPHQAAICLVGASVATSDFDVVVNFNNQINTCSNTGQTGNALDANPDFVGQGTGFNCSGGGLVYPYCNVNNDSVTTSDAFITCGTVTDPGSLSGPEAIAVITWTAAFQGTDNLTFGVANFFNYNGDTLVTCPSENCHGATVTKGGTPPPPTATFTTAPTSTSTPTCGGTGQATCTPGPTSTPTMKAKTRTPTPEPTETPGPPGEPTTAPPPPPPPPGGGGQPSVIPPATGTGSDGLGFTNILMWTIVGGAAFSLVLGGGLYLRRVTNR